MINALLLISRHGHLGKALPRPPQLSFHSDSLPVAPARADLRRRSYGLIHWGRWQGEVARLEANSRQEAVIFGSWATIFLSLGGGPIGR